MGPLGQESSKEEPRGRCTPNPGIFFGALNGGPTGHINMRSLQVVPMCRHTGQSPGLFKNQGPYNRPQIVGLIMHGHLEIMETDI